MTQFYRHTHPVFPEARRIRGPFFAESSHKSGVGWQWWEEETVFESHIAPLNVLHDLHPETQARHLSKPRRLSRKAEGGRGGGEGGALQEGCWGIPLTSLCPSPVLKGNTEKKPGERKGGARGRPSRCSPHPALVLGRQLSVLHCGGAQRGRDGPFRAEVTCREGLAPTQGSPESLQPCREEPPRICPLPFEPGLSASL